MRSRFICIDVIARTPFDIGGLWLYQAFKSDNREHVLFADLVSTCVRPFNKQKEHIAHIVALYNRQFEQESVDGYDRTAVLKQYTQLVKTINHIANTPKTNPSTRLVSSYSEYGILVCVDYRTAGSIELCFVERGITIPVEEV